LPGSVERPEVSPVDTRPSDQRFRDRPV